jgi:MFS family permease
MQFTMVSVSLPELTSDLKAPLRWSAWVITIFSLGQVIAQPVAGRLTERLGASTVFAGGLAAFGIASLVCAAAPNVYVMIIARFAQGIAGGGVIPAGSSIIVDAYGEGRARAIGLFASLIPFASVLGPTGAA